MNSRQRILSTILLLSLAGSAGAQIPSDRPTPGVKAAELVRRVEKLADSLARADRFSGVILLTRNGSPLFERAYGLADRESGRKNDVATTFNISSIGKLFTQIAIEQLVDAGKIDLDATVGTYWPDYPNPEVARTVTVRHLLAHRSGIGGDIFDTGKLASLRHNRDYLRLHSDLPLRFAPGSKQEYSNLGYILLGELVARVGGEDYYDYIQRHIFDPAGMRGVRYHHRDSLPSTAAIGYTRMSSAGERPAPDAPLKRNDGMQPMRGSAAGGGYASVGDLHRLLTAWRAGKLTKRPHQEQNVSAGGSPGSNGVIVEGLPGGYDLIVLSNFDPPAARTIGETVGEWLVGPRARPAGRTDGQTEKRAWEGFPSTPAGRGAEAYLRAFNSGDPATMRALLESRVLPNPNRTIDQRIEGYRSLYAEHGALSPIGISSASAAGLALAVEGARSGPLTLVFDVEEAEPYRIRSVGFEVER